MSEYEIHYIWIPCKKRLPESGKKVLCCGKRGGIYIASYGEVYPNCWWKVGAKVHNCNPIAWCPLPEPFREEEDE